MRKSGVLVEGIYALTVLRAQRPEMVTQRYFTTSACRDRALAIGAVVGVLFKRRRLPSPFEQRLPQTGKSAFSGSTALVFLASRVEKDVVELDTILACSNRISTQDFAFNFNAYGDQDCMLHFRFTKQDVVRMMAAIAWPEWKTRTARNRYATSSILVTCLVLRRLSSPARWRDLEYMFGKHHPQLSEIYWEALEHIWEAHGSLLSSLPTGFIQQRASTYATAIHDKANALSNCVGFIDGTVIGIARPKGYKRQKVVYNGHKRKHALKFQELNTPDGLTLHACGPMEGRRHDWTLYISSGLDEVLPSALMMDGVRYCIYGDSGYNRRWFMEVPFQGRT